jgi:hypothetical protein
LKTKEYFNFHVQIINVKRKSIFLVIVIFVFVFLCSGFTQNVYGNLVIVLDLPENPFITVPMLIIMFFIGARVEYAYFNSKKHIFEYVPKSDYRLFLRINLVTFPLTQILAYFFYIYFLLFFLFYIFLIEIGVVFIESYLLRIELQKGVDVELSSKFMLRITFYANIISFLVGFLAYLPLIIF